MIRTIDTNCTRLSLHDSTNIKTVVYIYLLLAQTEFIGIWMQFLSVEISYNNPLTPCENLHHHSSHKRAVTSKILITQRRSLPRNINIIFMLDMHIKDIFQVMRIVFSQWHWSGSTIVPDPGGPTLSTNWVYIPELGLSVCRTSALHNNT